MKRILFLFILLTVGFLFQIRLQAQNTESNVIDEVIWVVGDDAIFLSDVENMRLSMQIQGQRPQGDPYCTIPEQLAIQKLFLHQAKLDSVDINDSEVSGAVERQVNYVLSQLGSQEKAEEYLNKSLNAYRDEVRTMIKEQEAVRRVQQGLMGNIKITPSEVRTFYKRIPEDSLPYISTTVEVEIIALEPQVSLAEIDDIKNRLRSYTERVNNGEKFSTLARMYSDDKVSAQRGGELGFQGKGTLIPEFAAVAFDLNDPARVSRIVETEYGYHIIQLVEKRGDRINVRHILIRPQVTNDEVTSAIQKLDSIRNNIVAGKYSFEEGAFYMSSDKDTRNNKGLMVNNPDQNSISSGERAGTSRFEMSELPSEIAKVVNTMQVGDISKPFSMITTKTGREIVAIVKLKSRVEGHKASLSEDFQALKTMVEEEKHEAILNEWIAKKQKETYIRINDNWKNCDFEKDGWLQK